MGGRGEPTDPPRAGAATPPRPGSRRARQRPAAGGEDDWVSLLSRAVQRLGEQTACPRVAAWARIPGERPRLLAARIPGSTVLEPDPAAFEALAALPEATELGRLDEPSVATALAQGFTAAVAIDAGEGQGRAVLLTGEARPGDPVRPRTLAALASAAERLARPLRAAATARRLEQLDDQILQLDRLAAVGGLVAEIVHEIRNPLVSVKTFLQLLPDHLDDPEFLEDFLAVANEELRRIERLLEVVLEHGRPGRPARDDAHADVAACFDSVSQLLAFRAADAGVTLSCDAPTGLSAPRMGADALRQVVLNLAVNGIEAAPADGHVTLRARDLGATLELVVEDDGAGVPEAIRDRLFEPFLSTKDRPGGLGLAITRRLVDEAGGTVRVEPRTPRGSVFRVTLPVSQAE